MVKNLPANAGDNAETLRHRDNETWRHGDTETMQERCAFDPWVQERTCSKKWQPTPAFLPGKFHGQRSLEGYCQSMVS